MCTIVCSVAFVVISGPLALAVAIAFLTLVLITLSRVNTVNNCYRNMRFESLFAVFPTRMHFYHDVFTQYQNVSLC